MILNILTIITVIAGLLIFERAYEQGKSLLWHSVKFWMIAIVVGLQLWEYPQVWSYIPFLAILFWFGWDALWNKQHNMAWYYAGDGKGNFIELAVSWLHDPLKKLISYDMFMLSVKSFVLLFSLYVMLK